VRIEPVVLDSDTLSELSRGHPKITARARNYLEAHGRLTITAVSLFERLRGYRAALKDGKPFETHLRRFEAFAATCIVLPLDGAAADRAAILWAALGRKERRALGDLLIAGIACAHGLPLVTRNRRDFAPMARIDSAGLRLVDWSA
jgi:predicted nucleic acid-binding protein